MLYNTLLEGNRHFTGSVLSQAFIRWIPKAIWDVATRERTKHNTCRLNEETHLRPTMFLTRGSELPP